MFLASPPIKIEAERANQYSPEYSSWYVWTVFILSGIALAVWCLPYVPAVRYLALTSLLFLVMPIVWKNRLLLMASPISKLAIIWIFYLAVWPFFSEKQDTAIQSWLDEWGIASFTLITGAGAGWVLSTIKKQRYIYLCLAWLSLTPCLLQLFMASELWLSLLIAKQFQSLPSLPGNYWGIQPHHIDLGHSALTALFFSMASLSSPKPHKAEWKFIILIFSIGITSEIIASSRASIIFSCLTFMGIIVATFSIKEMKAKNILKIFFVFFISTLFIFSIVAHRDGRWSGIFHALDAGLHIEKPELTCLKDEGGFSPEVESLQGDFIRSAVLSVGMQELFKHPFGYDGSRSSFHQLADEYCPSGYSPLAHTHNGWLDMGISIGIPGIIIWLSLLISGLYIGWKHRTTSAGRGLWLCSLIIITRAIVDSTFRDHVLEMWGFIFMLFASALISANTLPIANTERNA